ICGIESISPIANLSSSGTPDHHNIGAPQSHHLFSTPLMPLDTQLASHVASMAQTPVPFNTQTLSTGQQTPMSQSEGAKGPSVGKVLTVKLTFNGWSQKASNFTKGPVAEESGCRGHWQKWLKALTTASMHTLKVNDIETLQGFKHISFNLANELDLNEEEEDNSAILQVKDMARNL
ncbi:hypothetical protein CROQUDRAFT_649649, partial [Cronartium quercuum f. sp. fusiforme G11]